MKCEKCGKTEFEPVEFSVTGFFARCKACKTLIVRDSLGDNTPLMGRDELRILHEKGDSLMRSRAVNNAIRKITGDY